MKKISKKSDFAEDKVRQTMVMFECKVSLGF